MMFSASLIAAYAATLTIASPVRMVREIQELDQAAFEEAHQRDDSATRAFSDIQIKTGDGRCLFVDKLSGDFRANLNPIEVADCGSTDGQGWDIITSGQHNDQPGQVLIVNTLTQACLSADPRREPGTQIHMFSCGGRADGGGEVTNSQLWAFNGDSGPLSLTPANGAGFCLWGGGDVIDIDDCDNGAEEQVFTFGEGNSNDAPDNDGSDGDDDNDNDPAPTGDEDASPTPTTPAPSDDADAPAITAAPPADSLPAENPTEPVPVSRAGGTLDPEAAAEAHTPDTTATKAREAVSIRSSDGQCLSIDPTAGDFRQNLIPVAILPCADVPNQKFDIVTAGLHNNGDAERALIVSALMGGCISFDPRRAAGDTVTVFSCGGRAAGGTFSPSPDHFSSYLPKDLANQHLLPNRGRDGQCPALSFRWIGQYCPRAIE
jgi:hypothetical protein